MHLNHLAQGQIKDWTQYREIQAMYRMCEEILEDLKKAAAGFEDDDAE